MQAKANKPPLHKEKKSLAEKRKFVSREGWEAIFDVLFKKHLI
jgi:hypothetical protein